jgi:putative NADH-flavin reductase
MNKEDMRTIAIIAAILLVGDRISTESARRAGHDVAEMTYAEAAEAAIDVFNVTERKLQ